MQQVLRAAGASIADAQARSDDWALRGNGIELKEAAALEKRLVGNPHDLEARITLLGFLGIKRFGDRKDLRYCKHVLWLTENYPGLKVSGSPWAAVHKGIDSCFGIIERLWDRHRRKHPDDSTVLRNAARIFSGAGHLRKAESALRRLQRLEPANPDWHEELARLYYLHGRWRGPRWNRYWAGEAFKEFTRAKARSSREQRYHLLDDLAEAAFDAGKHVSAVRYAKQLLFRAKSRKGDWSHGNAMHRGNTVLGLVAAAKGEVRKAARHLGASCRGVDSPQLSSFGPSTRLAEALLAHGEARAVINFLEQCKTFWRMRDGTLARWIGDIKARRKVDFMVRFDMEKAKKR